jgi:hypothetical protein
LDAEVECVCVCCTVEGMCTVEGEVEVQIQVEFSCAKPVSRKSQVRCALFNLLNEVRIERGVGRSVRAPSPTSPEPRVSSRLGSR